jgi:hypothetical protein
MLAVTTTGSHDTAGHKRTATMESDQHNRLDIAALSKNLEK